MEQKINSGCLATTQLLIHSGDKKSLIFSIAKQQLY